MFEKHESANAVYISRAYNLFCIFQIKKCQSGCSFKFSIFVYVYQSHYAIS